MAWLGDPDVQRIRQQPQDSRGFCREEAEALWTFGYEIEDPSVWLTWWNDDDEMEQLDVACPRCHAKDPHPERQGSGTPAHRRQGAVPLV